MKNYPAVLADVTVRKNILEHIFSQIEYLEDHAESYKKRYEEDQDCTWHLENVRESTALAEAYRRLADKLAK